MLEGIIHYFFIYLKRKIMRKIKKENENLITKIFGSGLTVLEQKRLVKAKLGKTSKHRRSFKFPSTGNVLTDSVIFMTEYYQWPQVNLRQYRLTERGCKTTLTTESQLIVKNLLRNKKNYESIYTLFTGYKDEVLEVHRISRSQAVLLANSRQRIPILSNIRESDAIKLYRNSNVSSKTLN